VRAMQCMQFRAKSAKNDLKPMDFLKCNFQFETEGVVNSRVGQGAQIAKACIYMHAHLHK
jgi:hypothetical protein